MDTFDVVAVPNAQPWLIGATSIDGAVLPVVDLGEHCIGANLASHPQLDSKRRLLVGGVSTDDENKLLGLVFYGLPIQFSSEVSDHHRTLAPAALASSILGSARLPTGGETVWSLDPNRLYEQLMHDASQ
jgi:chemotaxis signal transduction protein